MLRTLYTLYSRACTRGVSYKGGLRLGVFFSEAGMVPAAAPARANDVGGGQGWVGRGRRMLEMLKINCCRERE